MRARSRVTSMLIIRRSEIIALRGPPMPSRPKVCRRAWRETARPDRGDDRRLAVRAQVLAQVDGVVVARQACSAPDADRRTRLQASQKCSVIGEMMPSRGGGPPPPGVSRRQ